ncbi:MAG: response regulator, partial [Candidatus Sulfotelmatobacter sp.]
MRVLLVEDEQRLAENIVAALRETGLAVDHVADGEGGSHLAEQGVYDAIVLDLMLPGKSGQRVLQDLRRRKLHTPVLILTAQESKESVVNLLNAGADDYLSKPFDLGELLARIKALI